VLVKSNVVVKFCSSNMSDVEARLAALEKEVSRLRDEREVQLLMGRLVLNKCPAEKTSSSVIKGIQ
jgi:hypothetical protein